jgi:hypothetical protein
MILIEKQVWWNCKNRGMANIHIQRSLEIDNQVICEISSFVILVSLHEVGHFQIGGFF